MPVSGRGLAAVLLLSAFLWSLLSLPWSSGLIHPGGATAVAQMLRGLIQPALGGDILALAAAAAWRTLAYATAGMTVAVLLAVPLGVLASGVLSPSPVVRGVLVVGLRGVLGFLRGIHELVWAWLFVAAIGLSPIAAVLALGLPYGGILGRILADMLVDVPPGPLQALRSAGASEGQVLLYGRLPYALADMVSYTLYRFECAVRSAAIMSFVGLGGLGYQIQISLDDLKYDEVWTFVYFIILMVVCVDAGSGAVRRRLAPAPGPRRRSGWFLRGATTVAVGLAALAWAFVLSEAGARPDELFSLQTWRNLQEFGRQFLGVGSAHPAFLDPDRWLQAARLSGETLAMSVLAIGLAGLGMLATVLPAARSAAGGALILQRWGMARVASALVRAAYVFSRSVPELVWAMLVVFVLAPGILPGAIALALHNFGILGKLCAEVVEDLDPRPVRALRSCGAGTGQTLLYGVLPAVLPKFLTYLLYRWEVIIRTTIVVGFVSAGGLGRQFRLSMSWFHYAEVGVLLACYLVLVYGVELVCGGLRRLAR